MHASEEPKKFQQDDSAARLFLPDEAATLALGGAIAAALMQGNEAGLLIYLEGDLGAGKTTLVRGLLRALGHEGKVKSPTYNLLELYVVSGLNLYHFDFYRFERPEEYLDAGLDEYFQGAGICLVEWPDKAGTYLPPADLRLRLTLEEEGRRAELRAESGKGRRCLTRFSPAHIPGAKSSSSPPPP